MNDEDKTEIYTRLNYLQYKRLQAELENWEEIETTHISAEGFYHKALRLNIGSVILEIQGPTVKAPLMGCGHECECAKDPNFHHDPGPI